MASSPSPPPREPHLLRFGLRHMFVMVTLLSVLCASLVLTKGAWPLVIGVVTILVAAHVFGTMVGTRLRDTSQDVQQWRAANPDLDDDAPRAQLGPVQLESTPLPPTTPLADRGHANHWLLWFVLAGALLGFVVGGAVLGLTIGSRISWPGLIVGALSCGVLGSWAAFLASSFGTIARHAWRHAHEEGN